MGGFRQSMTWLHTWTGLLLGWVLYFMFVTGTIGYLDTEVDRWMQPEAPPAATSVDTSTALHLALAHLGTEAMDANRWFIAFATDRNNPYLRAFWRDAEGNGGNDLLDPVSGRPFKPRETGGGQTLYRMHWLLHYLPDDFTEWLISVVTMVLFVAMVTGVIAHKRIFRDFFTFRPGKRQRSWLDAHNALAVLSLPFQLMIAYSGLIFMMFTCMPLIVVAIYGAGDAARDRFFDEAFPGFPGVEAAGRSAPLVDLHGLLATVDARWNGESVRYLDIYHPGDANARVTIAGPIGRGPLRGSPRIIFDGVSGEVLEDVPARGSVARATYDVFLGLHEGLFAGPVLRMLYVLSGLMGTAMIATGLVLWTVKRRQRLEKSRSVSVQGLQLVERLNVGTIVGLPVAIAAYFWANRLLPVEMAGRADWEVHAMFLTWAALLVHAGLRPLRHAWLEQLWMAGAAYALLPVVNALTTDRNLWHSLVTGDRVFAGFDLSVLGVGLACAVLAWRLRGRVPGAAASGGTQANPSATRS